MSGGLSTATPWDVGSLSVTAELEAAGALLTVATDTTEATGTGSTPLSVGSPVEGRFQP